MPSRRRSPPFAVPPGRPPDRGDDLDRDAVHRDVQAKVRISSDLVVMGRNSLSNSTV
jgi:hypothetical protein